MRDLENREDLFLFVRKFYEKLLPDPVVGHFFTDVIDLDLEEHLPILVDYWDTILFGAMNYNRNPMKVHLDLHGKSPMEQQHFDRWVKHFKETMDAYFRGEKAELAKQRAHSIAIVIQSKIYQLSQS